MPKLFAPFKLRSTEFKNRIVVSPMCQYSAEDGHPTPWHLVHLGSRAVGGAALVIVEATGVNPEGRISPGDAGIWKDSQAVAWKQIVDFVHTQDALAGIQLAHAGRKASTGRPWDHDRVVPVEKGGWMPVAPSPRPFDNQSPTPHELTKTEIKKTVDDFAAAAQRSRKAGFDVIEIHAAHGYLLHEFLSPLSNLRTDNYGGTLENRMRIVLEVCAAARAVWPAEKAMFTRISATDYSDGGWDIDQSVTLAKELKKIGVDLIDCSSGGNLPHAKIPTGPGYQVPFAKKIRAEAGIATGAVGMITDPQQAEQILHDESADVVLLARELLRDPYWPRRAAEVLGVKIAAPKQYGRAW